MLKLIKENILFFILKYINNPQASLIIQWSIILKQIVFE